MIHVALWIAAALFVGWVLLVGLGLGAVLIGWLFRTINRLPDYTRPEHTLVAVDQQFRDPTNRFGV